MLPHGTPVRSPKESCRSASSRRRSRGCRRTWQRRPAAGSSSWASSIAGTAGRSEGTGPAPRCLAGVSVWGPGHAAGTDSLPAYEGATLVAALAAGRDAVRADGVSAETRSEAPRVGNADALVLMAENLLAAQPAGRGAGADRHQVVVHVDATTLAGDED